MDGVGSAWCSFGIEGDSNELGPNRRQHWRVRCLLVRRWRVRAAAAFAHAAERRPFFAARVRITFTLYRGRMLDPDNAHSSLALKAIVDAVKGQAFPDDKAACVEYGPLRQVCGARYRRDPEVEVLLEALA